MKTLYESILDDDQAAINNVNNSVIYQCMNYFREVADMYNASDVLNMEEKNNQLYVSSKSKNNQFNVVVTMGFNDDVMSGQKLYKNLLKFFKYCHFDNCCMTIFTYGDIPEFISNCNNCTIGIKANWDSSMFKNLSKYIKNTNKNFIIAYPPSAKITTLPCNAKYDLSGLNFGNNQLTVLLSKIDLMDMKNVEARALICQNACWGDFEIDPDIFDLQGNDRSPRSTTANKYFNQLADDNPKLHALGFSSHSAQYRAWVVRYSSNKNEFDWKYKLISSMPPKFH